MTHPELMVVSQFLQQNGIVAVLSLLVMVKIAVLLLAPAVGSAAFPFSLRWELGTQHSIYETLNDLAIKVGFSVIFQVFPRLF